MPTAAVLLSGSYVYLDDSDAGHQGSSLSDHRNMHSKGIYEIQEAGLIN